MFQPSVSGAAASTVPTANEFYDPQFDMVRHMLFGSVSAVQATIKLLHKLNYAEPNDWSKPIPTGKSNEVVVVLTKRVRVV
ncbi:hypothetical protein PN498_17155 [Oscillatoria sp. CS-180]|uniref:hypothetical protein n=1 Tax=Oscillatoria sp. CS-180 TaxID=3021720 RepID=UPI00232C3814|nr:hypothetical protein [Oscillatoria sp. CS-180]MDB9527726.1 hypothetical protein [Oscillatoria sp. CS-180]